MKYKHFAHRLLDWYGPNKRDLPWRNTNDPYIIWLSEVILQQTRVAQGLPYFEKFLQNYPKVQDLAQAPDEEVMRLWQGLGYYSRARNLHQCAKDIVEIHGGEFPGSYKELLKLKGVGSYTAAAISSFAFGEAAAVVDGNVFRVLSRYFGIETDIASPAGKREFETLANQIIPISAPGEFNQSIMEFGSLQCKPKNPNCLDCPLMEGCFAFNKEMVDQLPFKAKKIKVKERFFTYLHITSGNETVIRQRTAGDIWQGLHDFPLIESNDLDLENLQLLLLDPELNSLDPTVNLNSGKIFKHLLTHQRIFAKFISLEIERIHRANLLIWAEKQGYLLVNDSELENLGKPRLILKFLNGEK
ncbi:MULTISPECIES: A/G-specific adenine glycosylase [Rhodonellum]|uniref:Adenine DNA glycosylase n=1 Tax=Rhodonellum ikkaensis TaxID=336829 RepID=A0A1H3JST8_9BACT|nr:MULTISPECIES: A/G-specific adenine glycosylase [Rhodonellum]SDY42428.1 A/G-specific DNA-adenine glycosylase [Rhodonellum ikkaensis]